MFRDNLGWDIRVWRSDWPGDTFVNMTRVSFADFSSQCATFGIVLEDKTNDDD
jgi:predicted TIM-barrel fold metal-dependent hydrolase